MSPAEQVATILSDDKHVIYFYMPIIYKILEYDNVEKDDLMKLSIKFEERKMTPFNKRICNIIKSYLLCMDQEDLMLLTH